MMRLLVAASALTALVACGAEPVESAAKPSCPDPPPAETKTAQGWVGWLAAHPDDVAVAIDNGRNGKLSHRADQSTALASAGKVVHLAAYAKAVAEGRVRPAEPVRVADWERWYLPGTDAGNHPKALKHLGIPQKGGRALDPARTVRLDDMTAMMIRFSDNAVPDYLRARLGDDALRQAARTVGWADPDLPSFLGQVIGLLAPEMVSGQDRAARSAAEWSLARRYSADAAFRTEITRQRAPHEQALTRWADRTAAGSAAHLAALHRAISTTSFGPGADVARRHLEYQAPPAGTLGVGFKGGTLPGVLTEAMTVRRADGTTASAILLVRRMPLGDWETAIGSFAHQELLLAAMNDPRTFAQIRCAL